MKKIIALAVILGLSAPAAFAASLDVNASAAMAGTNFGLEVIFDGPGNAYVRDDTPADETIYRCQFWLDPATWNGNDAGDFFVISRATWEDQFLAAFQVMMVKKVGLWRLWVRSMNNTGLPRYTNRINLSPGNPSLLQVEWVQGDTPGALSGYVTLTIIDGYNAGQSVSVDLNNSNFNVDSVVLGALQPLPSQSGSIYLDEFASFRTLAP